MTEDICYLCGEANPDTREHVLPRCLLPKGNTRWSQRLTLKAHKKCNVAYSQDEEYLRDLLETQPAFEIRSGKEEGELVWTEPKRVFLRSDQRTENIRNRLKHFVSRVETMSVVHSHHVINVEHEHRQSPPSRSSA